MKRLAVVALLAMLLLAPATAGPEQVQAVHTDFFAAPGASQFEFLTACNGGAWRQAADDTWFEYEERDIGHALDPAYGATGRKEGALDTGCGMARIDVPVPAGNDHLHIRFEADRIVDQLDPSLTVHLIQEVRVLRPDGSLLLAIPYIDPAEGSTRSLAYDLGTIQLPALPNVTLEWYFEDRGGPLSQDQLDVLSGVAFSSRVSNVVLEFSDVPTSATTLADDDRQGTLLRSTLHVQADVEEDPFFLPALRVRVDPSLAFSHVVLPDGSRFDDVGTVEEADLTGFDLDRVQLEQNEERVQVTLTARLLERLGPGEYTFVFHEVESVAISTALIPLAVLLFSLPLPFAVFAFVRTRHF